jgi:hypothetical protein
MATPADQRLQELLAKWLASLELHVRYSALDNATYAKIQPWPEHQRPSRWIIDLARQKALALQRQIEQRIQAGDATFSDSLELMTFLANLVGSEHIERFIPLADASLERDPAALPEQAQPPAAADVQGRQAAPAEAAPLPRSRPSPASVEATGTREMPRLPGGQSRAVPPAGTRNVARSERAAPPPPQRVPEPPVLTDESVPEPKRLSGPSAAVREQVIADAVRLVQWGRKWYELAEIIAAMADRPHLTDVRRILKDNKAVIDKKSGRG